MSDYVTTDQFDKFLKEETEHHERSEEAGRQRGLQIDRVVNQMDSILKWRVAINQKIDKHDHSLYGNGEPGMDEVLRNINRWIDEQKQKKSEVTAVEKEITLMGIKVSSETKIAVINGVVTIVAVVLTAVLVGK
jgi:hypothetical protein